MWLANETAWGALPSLIPGKSQINRVSVSMAVWPLSHIKSGPFRLFDLTSISHVIDSPRDLFFSPISDSVSTFSANSLDNTRHSPSCTAVWTPSLLPCFLGYVSDPDVSLPLWPLMVYFVSNLILFSTLGDRGYQFSWCAALFFPYYWALVFIYCPSVYRCFQLKPVQERATCMTGKELSGAPCSER